MSNTGSQSRRSLKRKAPPNPLTKAPKKARAAARKLQDTYLTALHEACELPEDIAQLLVEFVPCEGVFATLDSHILESAHASDLVQYLSTHAHRPRFKTFTLKYRATEHGFEGYQLRNRCKNVRPMLLALKSKGGVTFGAFTNVHWSSLKFTEDGCHRYKRDKAAFLFAEHPLAGQPIIVYPTKSIRRTLDGLAFGDNDLNLLGRKKIFCMTHPALTGNYFPGLEGLMYPDQAGHIELSEIEVFECK